MFQRELAIIDETKIANSCNIKKLDIPSDFDFSIINNAFLSSIMTNKFYNGHVMEGLTCLTDLIFNFTSCPDSSESNYHLQSDIKNFLQMMKRFAGGSHGDVFNAKFMGVLDKVIVKTPKPN